CFLILRAFHLPAIFPYTTLFRSQVRLLFQFFIFFFPNKKRLPLWQPLSLNGKWLSSTIAPDCGTVKSMNIRLFKIDDQRNKSCEGCNYYSCIRVFWRIC